MLDKINNEDITIQIESEKIDVAVPDGLAAPKRNFDPNGISFVNPTGLGVATSLEKENYETRFENNELVYYWSEKIQTTARLVDTNWTANVDTHESDGYIDDVDFTQTRTQTKVKTMPAGPVLLQNKIPIPVEAGQRVSMAGTVFLHPIVEQQKDPADVNTSVNILVELYGVGYREDEYGEEEELVLKLISYEVNAPGPSATLNLQLPLNIGYVSVPFGIDRVFMSVSYKAVTTSTYLNVNYKLNAIGNRDVFRLPMSDQLRILLKPSETEQIIADNRLSLTTVGFKNRKIFSNVYSVFNYLTLPNTGFESDTTGWTITGTGTSISTSEHNNGSKSLKVIGNGVANEISNNTNFTTTPGKRHYAEAWIKADSSPALAGSGSVALKATFSNSGASPTVVNFTTKVVTTFNNTWLVISGSAEAPAGVNRLNFSINVPSTFTAGSLYIDSFSLAELVDDNELTFMGHNDPYTDYISITNPGFESGTTGWTGLNTGAGDAVVGTIFHSGVSSLKVVGSSAIHDISPTGYVTVAAGERIYAECWVRSDAIYAGLGNIQLGATFNTDGASPTYASFYLQTASALNTSWVKIYGTLVVPAVANRMILRLSVRAEVTSGNYYFDDIVMAKLSGTNLTPSIPPEGINIKIYEWSGVRGKLLKDVTAATNERKKVDVSSYTGSIEIERQGVPPTTNYTDIGMLSQIEYAIAKNTWVEIPAMIVDPTYLGSSVVSNKLVVAQTGTANLFPRGAFGWFTGNLSYPSYANVRIKKNGVVVPNSTFAAKLTSKVSGSVPGISLVAGDVLSIEGMITGNDSTISNTKFIPGSGLEIIYAVPDNGPHLYVESLLAKNWQFLDQDQNSLESITYTNITDEISSIAVERNEADAGMATIKFCSDQLDPITNDLLQIGKTIRILGRHYGSGIKERPSNWVGEALYEVVAKVKIKKIRVVYSYKNEPQIVVVGYDVYDKLGSIKLGVGFDQILEYGAALNAAGIECFIDDVEFTGQSKEQPSNLLFFPSTYGSISLMDSLIMARNTNMGYVHVNRFNKFIYRSSISGDPVKTIFTDGLSSGNLSVSDVGIEIDTENIINLISAEENLLDRKDFVDRSISVTYPPELFKTIPGKTRTIQYEDRESINNFGEYGKTFEVIRGNGSYADLQDENYGEPYLLNAETVLEEYSVPKIRIASVNAPVKDSDTLRILSAIDLLDKIQISYLEENYITRVRSIKHNIKPGRWTTEISFAPKGDSTYW